jgi:hypothetical protein
MSHRIILRVAEEGGKREFVKFLVLLFIVTAGSVGGYKFLDSAGRVPHASDTLFVIGQTEWPPGEYRECFAFAKPDGSVASLNCEQLWDFPKPTSDHTFPTRYWGRIQRPEHAARQDWSWRCQRRSESVTCWALN